MAENAPELVTREDKIAHAKELYAKGYRNYVVGDFYEAAEDLSRSCELNAELYGDESEEVAIPNLFYGKTLIELAQMGENKVLALPDQEEDDDDDDDDGGENDKENGKENDDEDDEDSEKEEVEMPETTKNGASSNNAGASSSSSSAAAAEPQPGTSSGIQNGNGNGNTDGEANENLQFAWEALEMAARIFRRLGVGYEEYLAEAHYGLAEILMENQNCTEAIRDYNTAFEIFSKVEPVKERCLAEIKYKTGLCYYTTMSYDKSMEDFQKSADYMQQVIEAQKAREETPEIKQTIDDLTTMREDIINKIAEVQETKQLLKNNLISKGGYSALLTDDVKSDKVGASSSDQSAKPKANDISHLVKRKKPDAASEGSSNSDAASPAKKPAL